MTNGIYTLANDVVLDQLIALLNSIEVNGGNIPVAVIPYDDRIEGVTAELERRKNPNVTLFYDPNVLADWEDFCYEIWASHSSILADWRAEGMTTRFHRMGMHRRFWGFDHRAPFDRFIYMDGDTLLLNSLDFIFNQLENYEFVTYDFQYKHPGHVYNLKSEKLAENFSDDRIRSEIFCAGFYGSHRGLFNSEQRQTILRSLQNGNADILYPNGPDQSILNYMVMSQNVSFYNFAIGLPPEEVTGNCVTSSHFEMIENLLYDQARRITFLHYIGLPSRLFEQVCQGVNLDFPYRDLFLHYRFLKNPEARPQFSDRPKAWNAPPSLLQKMKGKVKRLFQ